MYQSGVANNQSSDINGQETIAFDKVGKRKDKDGTGKYQDRVERRVIDSDPVNNDDG